MGVPALAEAERAAEQGARPRLFLPLAFPARVLEVAVLRARAARAGSGEERAAESRALPHRCARPLRGVPYAAQLPRRSEEQSLSGRREARRRRQRELGRASCRESG